MHHLKRLRAIIVLALLRLAFPVSMSGARSVALLPLPASAQTESGLVSHLLDTQAQQLLVDPANPIRPGLNLWQCLGSSTVHVPFSSLSKRSQKLAA